MKYIKAAKKENNNNSNKSNNNNSNSNNNSDNNKNNSNNNKFLVILLLTSIVAFFVITLLVVNIDISSFDILITRFQLVFNIYIATSIGEAYTFINPIGRICSINRSLPCLSGIALG